MWLRLWFISYWYSNLACRRYHFDKPVSIVAVAVEYAIIIAEWLEWFTQSLCLRFLHLFKSKMDMRNIQNMAHVCSVWLILDKRFRQFRRLSIRKSARQIQYIKSKLCDTFSKIIPHWHITRKTFNCVIFNNFQNQHK